MTTLKDIGEQELIRRLLPFLHAHPMLKTGAGDDCAVVSAGDCDWVLTTDPLIENTHFLPDTEPERIGHKAAGRVLSDIAAMGARPLFLLINIAAPETETAERIEQVYAGASRLADRFGTAIIGGDVAKGPVFELHVFGIGSLPAGTALLRSGAKPGDRICVTGPLGGSFESGRHLDFLPRVPEGISLRECGAVNAMMDISDGLATDLRHILKQSKCGAELFSDQIPLNETASLENALCDGEDFELLFTTAAPEKITVRFHEIGVISDTPDLIRLHHPDGTITEPQTLAFEHFRSGPK